MTHILLMKKLLIVFLESTPEVLQMEHLYKGYRALRYYFKILFHDIKMAQSKKRHYEIIFSYDENTLPPCLVIRLHLLILYLELNSIFFATTKASW